MQLLKNGLAFKSREAGIFHIFSFIFNFLLDTQRNISKINIQSVSTKNRPNTKHTDLRHFIQMLQIRFIEAKACYWLAGFDITRYAIFFLLDERDPLVSIPAH